MSSHKAALRSITLLAIAAALLLIAYAGGAPPPPAARSGVASKSTVKTIKIDQMKYEPSRLVVHVGDTIQWSNADIVPHTATTATSRNGFDSATIAPGK